MYISNMYVDIYIYIDIGVYTLYIYTFIIW